MSESSEELAKGLLSAFDLGPKWARDDAPAKKYDESRSDERSGERRDRGRGGDDRRDRRGGGQGDFRGGRRDGRGDGRDGRDTRDGRGERFGGRGGRGPMREGQGVGRDLPQPAEGVRVTVNPSPEAVHLVVREIHLVARVYSLFDVAQTLLAGRERYRLVFTSNEKRAPMWKGLKDVSLWQTKEEAVAHFWQSAELVSEFYESEEVEVEPPSGNFQVVARCGMSGEWLGPPNFHAYQSQLRRLHRERFSHVPFEVYCQRVKTERGEEAVQAWMETMKKKVRWRVKGGGDDAWTFERSELERDFLTRGFAEAFQETRSAEIAGDVPAKNLSVGLLACVRIATSHARKHPAILIPAICRMLENEHLAVFKRDGKLFTGPARPHPLADGASLAERPAAMVAWLESTAEPKLGDLWKAVLPGEQEEPCKEWLADLFWLLTQGHVLLFADDRMVLPMRKAAVKKEEVAEVKPAKRKKRKKRRKVKVRGPKVPSPAKMIRQISRMSPTKLSTLRGDALIWKRRLARRGKIASLVTEEV